MATKRGTRDGDTLTGGAGDDFLYGLGGTDSLNGGEGSDTIFTGKNTGDDLIDGGLDADGDDTDVLVLSGDYSDYDIAFAGGSITLTRGAVVESATRIEQIIFNDQGVIVVGANSAYTTIQAAVDAASDGDIILVQGGVYTEQLVVTGKSNLTIASVPGDANPVVIKAPADVVQTTTDSYGYAINAVVTVENSSKVVFQDIHIDGDGRGGTVDITSGSGPADFTGVIYRNASGSLIGVDITGFRDQPLNGVQRGFGLEVDNDTQLAFTMTGGSIADFQKGAAFINNAILDISGIHVTGQAASQVIGQNGFQITNSTGSFANNIIDQLGEAGVLDGTYATGLYLYGNTNFTVTGNTITGSNDVDTASRFIGIYVDSSANGGSITGNTISYSDIGIGVYDSDPADNPNDIQGLDISGNTVINLDLSDAGIGVDFEPDPTSVSAFTVTGSSFDDILNGGVAGDTFSGLGGNDTLDGKGGADTLTGGDGNDVYYVDQAGDSVVEVASQGTDTVHAQYSGYTLAANVENLVLEGTVAAGNGNGLANTITGNAAANTIDGGGGSDSIDGLGGFDTAVFSGNIGDYTVALASGSTTVSAGDVDTVTNVEALQFGAQRYLLVGGGSEFTTIQSAVDAASNGDIIVVQGGTYAEQLVLNGKTNLTIEALPGDTVNIVAPTDVVQTTTQSGSGRGIEAVVTVTNSTNVVFQNINVDGLHHGNTVTGGNDFTGVIYRNSSGSLIDVDITGVTDPTLNGNQRGTGLRVDNDTPLAFTMTGGSITDFQKNGARINGAILSITGVHVVGDDASQVIGQNGLQVFNSTGTISGNTIDHIGEAGVLDGSYATGLLLYGNTDLFVTGNTVIGSNDIDLASRVVGIYVLDFGTPNSGGAISGNILSYLDVGVDVAGAIGPNPIAVFGNIATNLDSADPFYSGVYFEPNDNVTPAFTVVGTGETDTLLGGASGDNFSGLAGADYLDGRGGNDTLSGGEGSDELHGQDGNDYLDGGTGTDTLIGGTGNDSYVVDNVGDTVTEDANAGTDLVLTTLASYTLGANVENLTYTGLVAFTGTGNGLNNVITGGAQGDTLDGGIGADTLNGGSGNDTLTGGAGNDILVGGLGDDTYNVDGGDTVTELALGGNDTVVGELSFNLTTAPYANIENATATGTGNFNLIGTAEANILIGNGGRNAITGGGGGDFLTGGAGNDRFVYTSTTDSFAGAGNFDRISDFRETNPANFAPRDLIDVFAIDARVNTNGNNAFTFIGTGAFHETGPGAVEGEIRYFINVNGNTVVEFNTDNSVGHAGAEMQIVLIGAHPLIDADFVL